MKDKSGTERDLLLEALFRIEDEIARSVDDVRLNDFLRKRVTAAKRLKLLPRRSFERSPNLTRCS